MLLLLLNELGLCDNGIILRRLYKVCDRNGCYVMVGRFEDLSSCLCRKLAQQSMMMLARAQCLA